MTNNINIHNLLTSKDFSFSFFIKHVSLEDIRVEMHINEDRHEDGLYVDECGDNFFYFVMLINQVNRQTFVHIAQSDDYYVYEDISFMCDLAEMRQAAMRFISESIEAGTNDGTLQFLEFLVDDLKNGGEFHV